MAYSREEQETVLVFDYSKGEWNVYSTVPKHIRKLAKLTELTTLELENGKPIAVKGILSEKQVAMRNPRTMSEEQKQKLANRLSEARKAQ